MGRQWKHKPPCKAHQLLKRLFENNQISPDDTASDVRTRNKEFLKFNLNVFRYNFCQLRSLYGLGLKRGAENGSCGSSKRLKSMDSIIIHRNQPILMSVYRDPETLKKKVIVVACLPGGVEKVDFSVVGSGHGSSLARVTYSWPPISYDIESLFASEIKGGMPICHPKIMALKLALRNHRDSPDDIPQAEIQLSLPIPVLTAVDSYTFSYEKKTDGSCILIADLKGFENTCNVKNSFNSRK